MLQKLRKDAFLGGGQDRIDAQHAKGKMTARERIEALAGQGLVPGAGRLRHPPHP